MCCADGNSWNGYKISPQKAYRYGRTPPCAPQPPYEEPAPDDVLVHFAWLCHAYDTIRYDDAYISVRSKTDR